MSLLVKVAKTQDDLDEAFRVRYKVFVEELSFIEKEKYPDQKEYDDYDFLPSTVHFIALENGKGVGTARLIGPNSKMVNETNKKKFGLSIEDFYDLSDYKKNGLIPYEISRSSVLKTERSSRVIMDIWRTVVQYTKKNNIKILCSCAGTETDHLPDARMISLLIRLKKLSHPDIITEPVGKSDIDYKPRYLIYNQVLLKEIQEQTAEEKINLKLIEEKGITLPATLDYYARIGFKFTGPPVLFSKFKMFTIPIYLEIDSINEPFKTFFSKESPFIEL